MKQVCLKILFIISIFLPTYQNAIAQDYIVGVGDVLTISVYDNPDLGITSRVDGDGSISMSLIGSVKVEGLSTSGIAKKLTLNLADGYIINPQVTVFIKEFRKAGVYYVTGEVRRPDAYKYEENINVIKAITKAGGLTDIAAQNSIKIIRKIKGVEKIIEKVKMDEKIFIEDVIVVPESMF